MRVLDSTETSGSKKKMPSYDLIGKISVVTAVLETLIFAGIGFGWGSISAVFREEGYFSSECVNITANNNATEASGFHQCIYQENNLIAVFTLANSCQKALCFPMGFVLDWLGTFLTRIIAVLFFTAGTVTVALSSSETSYLLYPATCFYMVGGLTLLLTVMPMGNLYPSRKSMIITALNGAFGSSSITFLVAKFAYDSGASVHVIFYFLTVLTALIWARTLFLMPFGNIPLHIPDNYKLGVISLCQWGSKIHPEMEFAENGKVDHPARIEHESPASAISSFLDCLRTVSFWLNVFHLCILALRVDLLVSQSGPWLQSVAGDDVRQFNTYVNAFGIIQFFAVIIAPFNGILIDRLVKFYKKKLEPEIAEQRALSISLFITSFLGIIFSISSCIETPVFVYISFALQVILRCFLYGGSASFLSFFYPQQHFGKLVGFTYLMAGTLSLIQSPLGSFVLNTLDGNFLYFHVVFVVVSSLTVIHPFMLYRKSRTTT